MNTRAVSPVIGVMLMLVITVILAAVVSSYSGSLVATEDRPWQIVISAKANTEFFVIRHEGGDPISLSAFKITIYDPETLNTTSVSLNDTDSDGIPDAYSEIGNGDGILETGEAVKIDWVNTTWSPDRGVKIVVELYERGGNKPIAKAVTVVD